MWSPNLLFQVLDQGRHARGGIAAIERRGNHRVMLVRTVLPGHDFIRVGLAPPIRRVGAEARQEQGLRVCAKNLRAERCPWRSSPPALPARAKACQSGS